MNRTDVWVIAIAISLIIMALVIGSLKESNKIETEQSTTYKIVIETHAKGLNPLGLTNPAKENRR